MQTIKLCICALVGLMFTCVLVLGCSETYAADGLREKNTDLPEKVEKAEKAVERKCPCPKASQNSLSEKQMHEMEECTGKYEDCIEACAKKDSDEKCDHTCIDGMSKCEKSVSEGKKTGK